MKSAPANEETPKRILVVDDDFYFRTILEKTLNQAGFVATCAENVKHAKELISLQDFDAVISDIRMPDETGIQLLEWIKGNRPLPVILMTGFSELSETNDAVQLGASGFLAKPFKKEELLSLLEVVFLPVPEEEEPKDFDDEFCKINIDDFVSGKEMKYDIFIRVNQANYIKVAHSGEDIESDRIQTYKAKGIVFLYMRKEDFRKYLNFNLLLTQAVTQSQRLAHKKKINFIKHTSEVMLGNLYNNEMGREDFMQAGALVENAVSLLSDNEDAVDLLSSLSNHTDFLYAHSVGVSLYSAMIGRKLKWNSPSTILKLSLGGLLHDVGKKQIPREILEKSKRDLTPEDVILLESHPVRGAEILSGLQCVPTDVLQIVHQHHENCMGFGYPSHLKKNKIHPLARVVSVANEFCNLVVKNPNSPGFKPGEAFQKMIMLNPEYYDEQALRALMSIFKIENPEYEERIAQNKKVH